MRRLPCPKPLPKQLQTKLSAATYSIVNSQDQKAEADRIYSNARKTAWFKPVVDTLKALSGPGQRCMFCSGSEASDVEHYKPKAVFPELAMTWENYLWSCTPCNRNKTNRFPPDTEPGGRFVNPLREDVWKFFFIDDYGFLTPVHDIATNTQNKRAVTTENFLGLNREALQETRLARLNDLKNQVRETLELLAVGNLTKKAARTKIKTWLSQPFQPDVADFFLRGPGKGDSPFKELFEALAA